MRTDERLQALIEYGADEKGIRDRFGQNAALYELCFLELLDGAQVVELAEAIREKDYARAFGCAHAVKGLSGNLGLTKLYDAISALVESLRLKNYRNVEREYAAVAHEFDCLRRVYAGEQASDVAGSKQSGAVESAAKRAVKRWGADRIFMILAIVAVFLLATISFYTIGSNYRTKVKLESGQHLLETGRQIGAYLENRVANDWSIARSVGAGIVQGSSGDESDAILAMLGDQRTAWRLTDLMLYTADGSCFNAGGITETNGTASSTIAHARAHGSALTIIASEITYTLPIETDRTFRGSQIVAVSVVRSLETLLDEFQLSSFDNEAWAYLTHENGVVISMLTTGDAVFTFNVNTLLDGQTITSLDEPDDATNFYAQTARAFYLEDAERYLVSVPIASDNAKDIRMRLFYIVPASAVNDTSNTFSTQLTAFSVVVITALVGLSLLLFLTVYRSRKKQYTQDIIARERLFDLLIQNTRTVFGLFDTSKRAPAYISANASNVLGDRYWTIERTAEGYRACTDSGRETSMLRQVNEQLRSWDGNSVFKSDYLKNDASVPPTYFELTLYRMGEGSADVVGILQDMTAAHDREEATKNAMQMAERSNEAKTRFLSHMSHDIRTPMNAIMNLSRLALDTADAPEKHAAYLRMIYDSSEHLLRLINEVLDMSRIESGQTVVASEPFCIKTVLLGLVDTVTPLCNAKKQTLFVDFDGLHAEAIRGDALKVSQIMLNLLSNAIKFTPVNGGIRFAAEELPSLRDDLVNIRFTVEDNGIGFSEETKGHIFEPFVRAHDARVGAIEGTGLGLSICKSYVEAMGGTIHCTGVENEGSTFIVELVFPKASIQKSERYEPNTERDKPFRGMRCLIVDDIETNRLIASTMLERVGFIADTANDGEEGVRMFLLSEPNAYDVIYMDIQMPILDGYQAAVAIRNSAHPQAGSIAIVAMSANVFAEDIEKARVSGMDGYIGKPVVTDDLVEQTRKALQNRKG